MQWSTTTEKRCDAAELMEWKGEGRRNGRNWGREQERSRNAFSSRATDWPKRHHNLSGWTRHKDTAHKEDFRYGTFVSLKWKYFSKTFSHAEQSDQSDCFFCLHMKSEQTYCLFWSYFERFGWNKLAIRAVSFVSGLNLKCLHSSVTWQCCDKEGPNLPSASSYVVLYMYSRKAVDQMISPADREKGS